MNIVIYIYFGLIVCLIIFTACNVPPDKKPEETPIDSLEIPDVVLPSGGTFQIFDTLRFIKMNERDGGYWCVSTDSLKGNDLDLIPPSELRIMRNEIYARYGYAFNPHSKTFSK